MPTTTSPFASPMSTSSPMVEAIMTRKRQIVVAEAKWKWGMANMAAALFILFEAHICHIFADKHSFWRLHISWVENFMFVLFLTNAILDLIHHFFPFGVTAAHSNPDLPLSPLQRKLFGIKDDEPGFAKASPRAKLVEKNEHPYGFSQPLNGSFISPHANNSTTNEFDQYLSSLNSSSWLFQPGSPPAHGGLFCRFSKHEKVFFGTLA